MPKCDFNKVAKQETPMGTSKTQTLDPDPGPRPRTLPLFLDPKKPGP